MNSSPTVVRLWMPVILGAVLFLFLQDAPPVYWLIALPLLPILIFMVTLAEIHDEGQQIYVKLLWTAKHIRREDILKTEQSFVDGIGVLRLKSFVFPWGRIFFIHEWSKRRSEERRSRYDFIISVALAISGFLAARAGHIPSSAIGALQPRILALVSGGLLVVFFVMARRKSPSLANFLVFAAGFLLGVVRW